MNDPDKRCPHGVRYPHECRECEEAISPEEIAAFKKSLEAAEEAREEPKCEFCGGDGAVRRPADGGPLAATDCEVCGERGSREKVARLNAVEEKRARGRQADRCQWSPSETAFQQQWLKALRPAAFLNGGFNILELLMSPTRQNNTWHVSLKELPQEERVTERDYLVAATVIQWLGTNMGRHFYEEAKALAAKLEDKEPT